MQMVMSGVGRGGKGADQRQISEVDGQVNSGTMGLLEALGFFGRICFRGCEYAEFQGRYGVCAKMSIF